MFAGKLLSNPPNRCIPRLKPDHSCMVHTYFACNSNGRITSFPVMLELNMAIDTSSTMNHHSLTYIYGHSELINY